MGVTMIDLDNTADPVLSLTLDGITVAVQFDRYDLDRCRYRYRVSCEGHNIADEGDDLSCVGEPDLVDALRTLGAFMRPDLFPNLHQAGADLDRIGLDLSEWMTDPNERQLR
jgi:hypothetical protein